jgi:hypothetical protein
MSKNSAQIASGIGAVVQNGYAAYEGLTSDNAVEQAAGVVAAGQVLTALAELKNTLKEVSSGGKLIASSMVLSKFNFATQSIALAKAIDSGDNWAIAAAAVDMVGAVAGVVGACAAGAARGLLQQPRMRGDGSVGAGLGRGRDFVHRPGGIAGAF